MPSLREQIQALQVSIPADAASAKTLQQLEEVRIKYAGRKSGLLLDLRKGLKDLPQEERPEAGKLINELFATYEAAFLAREAELLALKEKALRAALDLTLPGRPAPWSRLHPITQVTEELCAIFRRMGFYVAEGREIEDDYHNFQALNVPKDHPARDMQDTFYLTGDILLRTHTSPMQIRVMESRRPPFAAIFPGKTYRRDADVTHSPMFHQIEGLVVDKDISLGHLKHTLESFVHHFYGPETKLRFRPSFFPFTEPSAEVDITCVLCGGKGCRVCKGSGWLEILGAGMVDPAVFESVGYDPEEVTGLAFGIGVERVAMLKYGVDDIRLFFRNDLRFLQQFPL